jgi:hypothetical protein
VSTGGASGGGNTGVGTVTTDPPPQRDPAACSCEGRPRNAIACANGQDRWTCVQRPNNECAWQLDCPDGRDAGVDGRTDGGAALMCPRSIDEAQGKRCTTDRQTCAFPDGSCVCTTCAATDPVCSSDRPATWSCSRPGMGCPVQPPALGSACTNASLRCTYGCGKDAVRVCTGGKWAGEFSPCPVSRRAAKQEITYLDAAEVGRVSQALLDVKLATYEYKDPALAGRRRLGFIIDDAPGLPAIDPAHDMVDLYSYTSMLVATVQRQAQQIASLERKLNALEGRRRPRR